MGLATVDVVNVLVRHTRLCVCVYVSIDSGCVGIYSSTSFYIFSFCASTVELYE